MRDVRLNLGSAGVGEVWIDGVNQAAAVSGIRFESKAGRYTWLEVDVSVRRFEYEGQTVVDVPDKTRVLLMALGWSPPAEAGARPTNGIEE